tara:strand:- start:622 stop:747 length:126 start_codon:yes stop_codon:yes gene_type:complete
MESEILHRRATVRSIRGGISGKGEGGEGLCLRKRQVKEKAG